MTSSSTAVSEDGAPQTVLASSASLRCRLTTRANRSTLVAIAVVIAFALNVVAPATTWASDSLELVPDYAFFGLFGGPGLGSLWIMLIGFVFLIFPLNALIFQPIFRALDARAERIKGARERSALLEREADQVLDRYETAIREARTESEAARQTQLAGAREEQATLTTQARTESELDLERARTELGNALEEARATLRGSADDLAKAAAEQVLGRAL